jgi:hypothetical protein
MYINARLIKQDGAVGHRDVAIWQDPRNFPSPVQTAYTNWIPGEPNDFAIGEDYGLFSCETGYFPGGWNDGAGPTGGTPFSYIVEYVAVPEPSACFSLAAGIAFGCWRLRCRRTSDQVIG